jgi:leucyl-tRNA synthetase
LAAELWETLGEKSDLLREPWPKFDADLAREEEIEVPIQVNGKNRSRTVVPAGLPEADMRERALADEKIRPLLAGKEVVKVIVVPDKLVNIVAR